jgi:predicted metal-dependent hydrolase
MAKKETIELSTDNYKVLIEVEKKNIKNIHLSVYPPNGRVRISAPKRMDLDTIRVFAISKLNWIRKKQEIFKNHERETPIMRRKFGVIRLLSQTHFFPH